MAWSVNGQNLAMAEGDYGIKLPVTIKGTTLGAQDSIKLTFKAAVNGEEILSKEFDGIIDNTVSLELTEEESALLPVGAYVYSLDWYQSGNFMCNIIPSASLKVVDKA
jgi:hypothetical protein